MAASAVVRARPPSVTARGHAADEHAGILGVRLHANAVAKNRAAGVRAGGIDRDHTDGAIGLSQLGGQPIDEGALARPRRTGDADEIRAARLGEQSSDELGSAWRFVFNQGNRPRDRTRIAGKDAVGECELGRGAIGQAAAAQSQAVGFRWSPRRSCTA